MWQKLRDFFAKIHKNLQKIANLGEKFVNLSKIKE